MYYCSVLLQLLLILIFSRSLLSSPNQKFVTTSDSDLSKQPCVESINEIYSEEKDKVDFNKTLKEFHNIFQLQGPLCHIKLCTINLRNYPSNSTGSTTFCRAFYSLKILMGYLRFSDFKIVSISKVNCSTCINNGLLPTHSNRCENVKLHENELARLFLNGDCDDHHVSINTVSNYIPNDNISFQAGSMVVRKDCKFKIKKVEKRDNSPPDHWFDGNKPFTLWAFQKYNYIRPTRFTSVCGKDAIAEEIATWIPNADEVAGPAAYKTGLSIGIPIAVLMCALVVFAFVAYRSRLLKKINENYELMAIKRFRYGESNDEGDGAEENGYVKALKLPYEKKYEISRNNLKIDDSKTLGSGMYGQVLLGKLKSSSDATLDDTLVAVKVAKCSPNVSYFLSLLDEIKILVFIGSHPNIVQLVGACTDNIQRRDALIILELCAKGSLKNYLLENKGEFLSSRSQPHNNQMRVIPPNDAGYARIIPSTCDRNDVIIKPNYLHYLLKWAINIAAGMEYLSSKQVVHVDVAIRNILLTEDFVAKISDFGLSRKMKVVENHCYCRIDGQYPLPFRSMAPESLMEYRFSTQSDVWSYGVTLWEMFSFGATPYSDILNQYHLVQFLNNNQILSKPCHSPTDIYHEMSKCWAFNPMDRPSFTELKASFIVLNNCYDYG